MEHLRQMLRPLHRTKSPPTSPLPPASPRPTTPRATTPRRSGRGVVCLSCHGTPRRRPHLPVPHLLRATPPPCHNSSSLWTRGCVPLASRNSLRRTRPAPHLPVPQSPRRFGRGVVCLLPCETSLAAPALLLPQLAVPQLLVALDEGLCAFGVEKLPPSLPPQPLPVPQSPRRSGRGVVCLWRREIPCVAPAPASPRATIPSSLWTRGCVPLASRNSLRRSRPPCHNALVALDEGLCAFRIPWPPPGQTAASESATSAAAPCGVAPTQRARSLNDLRGQPAAT